MINFYLIAFASISAICYAAIDMKDICERGPPGCVTERHRKSGFPGTPSELEEFCELAMEFLTCTAEYSDICFGHEHPERSDQDWAMVRSVENICDKDGEIYNGLVEHIGCIKDTLQNFNETCRKSAFEVSIHIEEKEELEYEDYARIGCLRRALDISCVILKVDETCGVSGEKAFVAVANELKKSVDLCEGAPIEDIRSLAHEVEIDEELRVRLLAFLSKK